jgi:lysophospholipase L1-like esterase
MAIALTSQDYNQGISNEINCFGDSLTQGAGSSGATGLSYPAQLSNILYPRLIQNLGMGGQSMEQIASRQGAKPIYVTLNGNAFNGVNNVSITSISSQFLSMSDTVAKYASGIINGVPCIITRTVVSSVETYVIKGANNSTATIPANSIFYPDSSYNALPTIQVFWWGRNNVPNLTGLDTLIDNAVSIMPSPRRFLVIGVKSSLNEIIGTTNYNACIAMNAILSANYPNNYIAITPPTNAEMSAIMYTPSAQDNTDIANGVFPTGMHADNTHLNGYGYNIVANRVALMLKQYGW